MTLMLPPLTDQSSSSGTATSLGRQHRLQTETKIEGGEQRSVLSYATSDIAWFIQRLNTGVKPLNPKNSPKARTGAIGPPSSNKML
jgi:hypothetical protein